METTALTMFQTTVIFSGDVIFIKPFCDFFEIDYKHQIKKIAEDPILIKESQKKPDPLIFGDKRERRSLSKKGFLRWIQRLNFNIVKDVLREKLEMYQSLIFDYLYGSTETESQFRIDYSRLSKLKSLRTKIGSEISKCEAEIRNYLENKAQLNLQFPVTKIEK